MRVLRHRLEAGAWLIFAAVLLAYLPVLRNGFVWNDTDYVTRPELQPLSGLGQIWFHPGATEQYYPVLHTAFWIEHRLWGESPLGYHLLNVMLHAGSACLFALVLLRLRVPGAWLAGLIFALHPICAESVAWISEQKNTLSTLFYLLAALAYLRFDGDRSRRMHLLSLGLFALALLSKSVTATLPAALLVVFWWKRGRLSWRTDVWPMVSLFVLGAAVGLFTAWIERASIGAEGPEFALDPLRRTLVAGHALWFYLGKLFWPAPLIFMYPRWDLTVLTAESWLFPVAAVMTLLLLWGFRKRSRAPLAAALLFAGTLFPVLGFFNVYAFVFSFVADHFQYLACLAIIASAAAAWEAARVSLASAAGSLAARIAAAAVLFTLGALTWSQCGQYRDVETLYRSILSKNPDSWLAHYNLGNLLREGGHTQEAIVHYEQTVRIDPRHYEAENNLGLALADSGQVVAAVSHYERALALKPDYAAAANNLGTALWALGKVKEALDRYREALLLNPEYAEAWYNLGLSLSALGRIPESVACLDRAVALRPAFPEAVKSLAGARNNLGIALYSSGRLEQAVAQFNQALHLNPNLVETHLNLAAALRKLGHLQEALEQEKEAQRLKALSPSRPKAEVSR